ncbi:TetR family transcriptional regulator [Mycobacterium antarcticum]|uniref:TetR/AcrR family transcriptional regulator n=1 Tax=unclassified Mycolicibacterium TaxID=2636767 RepID=UPI00239EEFFB|nr:MULTISPECIES: TetR/AcrR family transcriptional regulator [unclassified Mycolicibacterium]BDX33105.1 TetR family transcriptional regulator [Mycolicibacterium sp. TUM20985]GLP76279.1 TetR family transcriptional regulator [Mycolicibacterium sp. TUM20983]GLP83341.1 TetR family transcriptional regulator [Mycolicibacterium sp. TUM20984]
MTRPLPGDEAVRPVEADTSTRERILAATAEVLGSNGINKLSLSDVATQAGVSRPTLYRWFGSKQDLLDAFVVWERSFYEQAVARAYVGLPRAQRLEAALRVIVEYQHSYPGLRMVDVEPEHVIPRLARVIPLMRRQFERLIPGPDADIAAAAVVRVAISHYLVRSDDDDEFLAQLKYAAGHRHSRS